ncbi:MAG: hypothetical protein C0463_08220 [Idiomarina sp.]|nr:hypothetical protein [Idiomarina sp.]
MNNLTKASLVFLLTTALAACGGGSDSDNNDTGGAGNTGGGTGGGNGDGDGSGGQQPGPLVMTINAPSAGAENSTTNILVTLSGGEGAESVFADVIPLGNNSGMPDVSYTDDGFGINFGVIGHIEETYSVTVTGTKGDEFETETFEISVPSDSGNLWLDRATTVRELLPAQRLFIAEWAMIEQLTNAARIHGSDIDLKELTPIYLNAIHANVHPDSLLSGYVSEEWAGDYTSGERSWVNVFSSFKSSFTEDECTPPRCFGEHLSASVRLFDFVFDKSTDVFNKPAYGYVQFDNRTNTYSMFYVDGDNGSFDGDGNWSFKPEFEYLSSLIAAGHQAAIEFTSAE